jgi:hypothetical protein
MANPVVIACPEGQWTKVATALTSGQLWRMITTPQYLYTYRDTTGPVPTDLSDAVAIDNWSNDAFILSYASPADVYIYARGAAGQVRKDE